MSEELKKYMLLSDDELGSYNTIRWELLEERFDVIWDSARSRKQAVRYVEQFYPEYSRFEIIPVPATFREACEFIDKHHRHHPVPQGMEFAHGISNGLRLVGVITASRPVSRIRDNGWYLKLPVSALCGPTNTHAGGYMRLLRRNWSSDDDGQLRSTRLPTIVDPK